MAIYRFEAKPVKRSEGRNALACAAYRAAERLADERTGQVFDYDRRSGVVHTEICAPENAPAWATDRQSLWQAVEAAEKRKDAQLAREVLLALPHELTDAERVALVHDFAETQFVSKGMVADISLHAPDREGDNRNHHAHILLTMRELGPDGFGAKQRDWNDTGLLQGWREAWESHVNEALERGGHEARVDHRSLEAQGIDREPEPKVGPVATEIEREGRASRAGDERRAVQERNAERERLRESAEIIDIELERQKRAADLFDRGDYVSSTQDAQKLVEKHWRERPEDEERTLEGPASEGGDRRRAADESTGHDATAPDERAITEDKANEKLGSQTEKTDAKQTAFERLLRNLEADAEQGEHDRPKESGRDTGGGRQRGR
ncbi:MAG: hypothetical protein GC131_04500 [Alphaproteobacteria bacterium]|nr:hypothetical protein [Alphaproteobacteria bacterium]